MSAKKVTIASYLDAAMKKRGVKKAQLAAFLGVSHATVGRWLEGESIPSSENCRRLATYLHEPQDRILELAGHRTSKAAAPPPMSYADLLDMVNREAPTGIPVYEQLIHAGTGAIPLDYVYLPKEEVRARNLKAAPVKGDCMEPTIQEGDLIIVDMDGSPVVGDIVVALVDKESVEVKRLKAVLNSHVILSCDNPAYPDMEVEDVRIVGVVIKITRDIKRGNPYL